MYSNKIKIKNKVRSQGIAMAEGISYPVYSKGTNRCSRRNRGRVGNWGARNSAERAELSRDHGVSVMAGR
jgi:hypothetical protein